MWVPIRRAKFGRERGHRRLGNYLNIGTFCLPLIHVSCQKLLPADFPLHIFDFVKRFYFLYQQIPVFKCNTLKTKNNLSYDDMAL